MTVENDVRAASTKFYSALNRMLNGDAGSLGEIWSHSATVTTMHPIGDTAQSMIDVLGRLGKKT